MAQLKARTELLTTSVKLERSECLRGESVHFEVTLQNTSTVTIQKLPDLSPQNRTIQLVVEGGDERRTAKQGALSDRVGRYKHGAEEPVTTIFKPGQKLQLRDDLLSWFGELPPGDYQITAVYEGALHHAVSEPAALKVLPSSVIQASTPRYGAQGPPAPMTAAFVHRKGEEVLLFYQQQAAALPRIAVHGVRAALVKEPPAEVFAAAIPGDGISRGHLLWIDEHEHLMLAVADVDKARAGSWAQLDPPFKGRPLASPLTMPDGGLFLPFADPKKEKVAILHMEASGSIQAHELDLGKVKPVGPYACYWEYDSRLHFAWAAPNGREIQLARLPLDDPASGFSSRSVYLADDPIVWIDAYLDTDAQFVEAPYFEEQIPPGQPGQTPLSPGPRVMIWCVVKSSSGLRCLRVSTASNQAQQTAALTGAGDQDLRVIASAVTYDYELALLLADDKDELYYASTLRGAAQPLSEVAGKDVKLTDFPGLIAASRESAYPWVHLRYVEDGKLIDYVRLEPADERDPVESEAPARSGRRRGR